MKFLGRCPRLRWIAPLGRHWALGIGHWAVKIVPDFKPDGKEFFGGGLTGEAGFELSKDKIAFFSAFVLHLNPIEKLWKGVTDRICRVYWTTFEEL